ncbi:MAG: DNA polymerase III subunit beta, partial [Lentisphaeria bacterium]
MQVAIEKEILTDVIRKVSNVVNTKTTIPVLNNIYLEAQGDKLYLAATDLEVYIRSGVDAKVERQGKTTLPARKFAQIINALPDGEIKLETGEQEQTSISCEKSFFKMTGLSADEFPEEEELNGDWTFTISSSVLKKMLHKVSYAASTDENRHVLNGVLFSIRSGMLTAVGTDGRRLALIEQTLDDDAISDCDVILPPKIISELMKVLDKEAETSICLTDSRAAFSLADSLITSKLVEGTYPNYRQVIPASYSNSVVMPRETLAEVVNRVAMVVTESSASIKMNLENTQAVVSAMSAEVGESSEPIEISYEGEPMSISFNPQFLVEPLKHM